MQSKKYTPLVDKLFYLLSLTTLLVVLTPTVVCGILEPSTLFITLPIFIFTAYFFVSPLCGYVELRDGGLYIKYGFIVSRTIPYEKIRRIERERKIISPRHSLDQERPRPHKYQIQRLRYRHRQPEGLRRISLRAERTL